jgi:hypothetical protein
MYSLELGDEVANLTCGCCGKPFKSVYGFIKKDDWAHSMYFATLQTGHDEIGMGLEMRIEDPNSSRHVNSKILGQKLDPASARQSPLRDEFFAISGFVLDNDPAVLSYLSGKEN